MTSGRGSLHEEMPRRGPNGTIYGFQLWVNLPKRLKISRPRYEEVAAASIPTYEDAGRTLRVVAGTVEDVAGPVARIAAAPLTWMSNCRGHGLHPAIAGRSHCAGVHIRG